MNYNWNWKIFWDPVAAGKGVYWEWLISGLGWTIAVALCAWTIALVLGSIIGTLRTVPNKWLARFATCYVELFRNIPLLVQMFIWYFVLPELLPKAASLWVKQDMPYPSFVTAVLCLGIYTSSRVAEQVKAGILSLPKGQKNAALAMGFTEKQTYFNVILPQAFRIVIPPLTSEFTSIVKNSSVALTIGLLELTQRARDMSEYTFQTFEAFTAATVFYFFITFVVVIFMNWFEKRVRVPGLMAIQSNGGH